MTRLRGAVFEASQLAYEEGKSEIVFMDRLLEGWAYVSRNTNPSAPREPVCTLGRFVKPEEVACAVVARSQAMGLDDDQFMAIDRLIARMPRVLRRIVFVEYWNPGPQSAKARGMKLSRTDYRERLLAAQWALYVGLGPWADRWRERM